MGELRAMCRSGAWVAITFARRLEHKLLDPIRRTLHVRRTGKVTASAADRERFVRFAKPAGNARDVVCLAMIPWDFRFQRPQQLMRQFGAAGHRVFYVNLHFRTTGPAWAATEKAPNVYEVTLRGPRVDLYRQTIDESAWDAIFDSLSVVASDLVFDDAATSFVHLPSWWPLVRRARERFGWRLIYDCFDDHSGFTGAAGRMVANERELAAAADLVVASSSVLDERMRTLAANVLLLRNGCDYEHFAATERKRGKRPVIGYYGAISDWFDSDLVAVLADRRPDWDFVLVGSTSGADTSRLRRLPNVSLPGERSYESLPRWLGRFDVAVIPFKASALTNATNPVKVYEMLAAGMAIVSVPMREVVPLVPLVRLASSSAEFEREISAALEERDEALIERRRSYARQNTWRERYGGLARAVAAIPSR